MAKTLALPVVFMLTVTVAGLSTGLAQRFDALAENGQTSKGRRSDFREWTDSTGKHRVIARLISVNDNTV